MQLREHSANALAAVQVDEASRTIKGVALAGRHSANGYVYSEQAFRQAVPLYGGKPVFLDHEQTNPRGRSARDLAGHVTNPRYERERMVGDIRVLETDAGRTLLAMAKENQPGVGMSHVVLASKSPDGQTVEAIEDVISVDAVCFPATTHTFKEQVMDLATLRKDHPDLVKQIESAATQAEKDRLAAEATKQPPAKPADPPPAKTAEQIQQEAIATERKRQSEIRAVCEKAGCPDLADGFCSKDLTLAAVREQLLEKLCERNTPPTSDRSSDNPLSGDKGGNSDAKFKAEYAANRAAFVAQGLSEKAYIHSRRIDEGLDALTPGAAHLKS